LQTPGSNGAKWTSLADMPVSRSEMPATTLDGQIYIAGGFGAGTLAHRYDPQSDEWTQLADLPVDTNHLGIATVGQRVVVAGGYGLDGSTAHDGMWAYLPDQDQWEEIGRLPDRIGAFGLAPIGEGLYLVGGAADHLGGEPSAKVHRWDADAGRWDERAPLSEPREHLAVVSEGTAIYAIGGRARGGDEDDLGSMVERYDAEVDKWELLAPLPVPRSGLNGAALCGGIAVIGGETGSGVHDEVSFLDPAADVWQELAPLPTAVHGVAVAAIGDRLFAIGGSTVAGEVNNVAAVTAIRPTELGFHCG
jgi:N-acetylneuraminic acid mutarotase